MSLPRTAFCYLRHGETDFNARGLSQGALDVPLNARGRAQAEEAGETLRHHAFTRIVCSPLGRARETAAIVNRRLNLPLAIEPGIREVMFGGMEGKPLLNWFDDWVNERAAPEGAEHFSELRARVGEALARILGEPGTVLIVSHGGVFRAVRVLLGLPREGRTPNAVPLFCAPSPAGWRIAGL